MICFASIQTRKRFKRTLFIRTKHIPAFLFVLPSSNLSIFLIFSFFYFYFLNPFPVSSCLSRSLFLLLLLSSSFCFCLFVFCFRHKQTETLTDKRREIPGQRQLPESASFRRTSDTWYGHLNTSATMWPRQIKAQTGKKKKNTGWQTHRQNQRKFTTWKLQLHKGIRHTVQRSDRELPWEEIPSETNWFKTEAGYFLQTPVLVRHMSLEKKQSWWPHTILLCPWGFHGSHRAAGWTERH